VDLTTVPGTVSEGKKGTPKTTVTLAEEDLYALVKGTPAATLHQHGKLRVDGDVRPAHKLSIFKDLV
jgi:3-hydroxyacyl-CoA dehydrogenase/3a,7a,12a-trihydroxy-5b-cholest-24-enoyl-CoA hydratase